MPSNKDRLYIALHPRGGTVHTPLGQERYHWSLVLAPKGSHACSSDHVILHAKETLSEGGGGVAGGTSTWVFEERRVPPERSMPLLARVCVAKVVQREKLLQILRAVPVRAGEVQGWNCVGWVREALARLEQEKHVLGRNVLGRDWEEQRDACTAYVKRKKEAHRYDGQAAEGEYDMSLIPTWDMLLGRETVP